LSGDGSIFEALSDRLAQLENGAHFTVAELTASGLTVWTVSRDSKGTPERPRAREFTDVPVSDPADFDDFYATELAPLTGGELILVACPDIGYPDELLSLLTDAQPGVPVHECLTPLKEHLRNVITTSPLRDGYELVVLRQGQDGLLTMDLQQLFPPDATSGYPVDLKIRCAPSDDRGTVFAVMIRDRRAGATPASPRLRPIEVRSAKIPPGDYDVSAVLVRPGHVEFRGLPAPLVTEARPFREIAQSLPARLPTPRPVHLVCMLEVTGPEYLEHRIERLEELINVTEASGLLLRVSLITYGPHSVGWATPDEPATAVAWATRSDLALRKLATLKNRVAPDLEYQRAAQLECALREVSRMFAGNNPGRDGRPVLITAGTRPPHPERVDMHSEIIPCPSRVSWQRVLGGLVQVLPELRFGALCNAGAVGSIWSSLGRDAIEEVDGVVDVPAFAARLGLRGSAETVPFPLV